MSVRFGMLFRLHHRNEAIKEIADVMRPGRCFGVTLEAEGGFVRSRQALQRVVEQADVRGAEIGRQRFFIDRKTVVLAGDADAAVV